MKTLLRNWPELRWGAIALFFLLISGCAALRPDPQPHPSFYTLNYAPATAAAARSVSTGPTLLVSTPLAAAGFDSPRIIYLRQTHKLEYFAHSEWVDTPARMLTPLLIAAVEHGGSFRAVAHAPGPASGDLRLDTEVLLLQHEFTEQPSRVRFVLRAYVVEESSRRVVATRQFEASVIAPSEDTYGGVVAANQAVQHVLESVAAFCAEAGNSR